MTEGRRKLSDYNKENGLKITLTKEQTLSTLRLLIRKRLTSMYHLKGLKAPDMSVKKGYIHIGKDLVSVMLYQLVTFCLLLPSYYLINQTMKSPVAAIKLGLPLPEWKGIPVEDLLSERDRTDLMNGHLKYSCLTLPGLENDFHKIFLLVM
ncbi:hypothetical protein COOONC_17085 [Cooperia oncophora]